MKRRFDLCERDGGTPKAPAQSSLQPLSGRTQKRMRPLRALITTPAFGSPLLDTPESVRARQAAYEPSTAERKMAGISLAESPVFGLTQGERRNYDASRFSRGPLGTTNLQADATQQDDDDDDDDEGDDDYGFSIRCSQTYNRLASQQCEPCNTPQDQVKQANLAATDSQEASQCHFSFPSSNPEQNNAEGEIHGDPLSVPPSQALVNPDPAAADTTPEFNDSTTVTSVAEEGGTHVHDTESSGMKMFPIFRPRAERKTLLIIRHGESEYNKAAVELGGFADPRIFDPKLTARGRTQENSKKPLNIEILSCISEHVASCGDVGRPPEELTKEFPQLAEKLKVLKQEWWLTNDEKPNCALSKSFNTYETKEQLRIRVTEFERWLSRRSEKFVVCIGHSTFWKEFQKTQKRMKNGECALMVW